MTNEKFDGISGELSRKHEEEVRGYRALLDNLACRATGTEFINEPAREGIYTVAPDARGPIAIKTVVIEYYVGELDEGSYYTMFLQGEPEYEEDEYPHTYMSLAIESNGTLTNHDTLHSQGGAAAQSVRHFMQWLKEANEAGHLTLASKD